MMDKSPFSVRNGYNNCKFLHENDMTNELRMQVWHLFSKYEEENNATRGNSSNLTLTEDMLVSFGLKKEHSVYGVHGINAHQNNVFNLQKFICETCKWYHIYDFIEIYISLSNDKSIVVKYNAILEKNLSAYRIIEGHIVPVMDKNEIAEIEKAANQPDNRSKHIQNALEAYANKANCDYNKVITSAISALEASCVDLVDGKKDTLGQAIKLYENGAGANEDKDLLQAIRGLYKFSCNAGIRHGGTEYHESGDAEARLFLIVCSALSNYLASKMEDDKNNKK